MKGVSGDYYLGLDIGTNSVGWAVTDTEYNIPNYGKKAMWGIHLFETGNTAAERRMYRCARRRLERKRQRIALLRELMRDEVYKVDPAFFIRLDESFKHAEDRELDQPNSLFNDVGFTDKEYHKRFPTVYHLRRYLMDCTEKPDIRLIYLAIHHIIKYRGHFLFGDISGEGSMDFGNVLEILEEDVQKYDMSFSPDPDALQAVLTDRFLRLSDRKSKIRGLLECDNVAEKEMATLLSGGKTDLSKLFSNESYKELKIEFGKPDAEDKLREMEDSLDQNERVTLELVRRIYDWSAYTALIGNHEYISDMKIAKYDLHMSDLKSLKAAVRRYASDRYGLVFRDGKCADNYVAYTKGVDAGGIIQKCDQESFCKFCSGVLSGTGFADDPEFEDIRRRMDSENHDFMPMQSVKSNSLLPFTVHRMELDQILKNMEDRQFYPELSEKGKDGLTFREKVLMLEEYRVPYYVGPLMNRGNSAWVCRRSNEHITPWNFDDVVDKEASERAFIENLTRDCTYMIGEKVLPKNSIAYSRYMVLNALNIIRINGDKLPVDVKKRMFDDLFLNREKGRVTVKVIKDYLVSRCSWDRKEEMEITGIDGDIKSDLSSERMIREAMGDRYRTDAAEDIIMTLTVFNDSKTRKARLEKEYWEILSADAIRKLSARNMDGWGRFSLKFLTGIKDVCSETGIEESLLDMLYDTDMSEQELLSKYSFNKQIEEHNNRFVTGTGVNYSDMEKLYLSPSVKRSVWRSIRVARDVVETIGHPPKRVFIETTRGEDEEKKRTVSRRQQILELYENAKEDPQWRAEVQNTTEVDFKPRNVFLYYTQLGKCMYCGRDLNLNEEGRDDSNREHIYPRSLIKDDSIKNNLILTCRVCNEDKSNSYPIRSDIQIKMGGFWKMLHGKGYISTEKYSRLIRTSGFSEDDKYSFINRQLVETSQSVKAVIGLFKRMFNEDTEIVYVKAALASEFRQENKGRGMVKCRSVNDLHHAKDAYLNIVVGNVYHTKFTSDYRSFLRTNEQYNFGKMYEHDVSRNGFTAWKTGEGGSIATVSKYMRRNNILYTRFPHFKGGSIFSKDTTYPKKKGLCERKAGLDPEKYGGYMAYAAYCYSLLEYDHSKGVKRMLSYLPSARRELLEDPEKLREYYRGFTGKDVRVVIPSVKVESFVDWGGFRYCIGGRTNNNVFLNPAIQLITSDLAYAYCKILYSYDSKKRDGSKIPAEKSGISLDDNLKLYAYFIDKMSSELYAGVMDVARGKLESAKGKFEELDLDGQSDVLNQILNQFSCNAVTMKLKKLGLTDTARICKSMNLPKPEDEEVYLIRQSPSGLHEQRIRMN